MEIPVRKKVTSIHPLVGALSFMESLKDSMLGKDVSGRATSLTDELGDITIDTCLPSNTGVWETGIKRDSIEGKWIIVSQYESDEEATREHKKWVELMKQEPTCDLKDINNWNLLED